MITMLFEHTVTVFPETHHGPPPPRPPSQYFLSYIQGSGIVFYVSNIHSSTGVYNISGKSSKRRLQLYQIIKITDNRLTWLLKQDDNLN